MLINYKNVNVYQDSGIKVLEGVNLEVNEGEMVYVIGRVGSGKSSLLKTLYGDWMLTRPTRLSCWIAT